MIYKGFGYKQNGGWGGGGGEYYAWLIKILVTDRMGGVLCMIYKGFGYKQNGGSIMHDL